MFRFPASRFLTAGAVAGVAARRRATLARGSALGFLWGVLGLVHGILAATPDLASARGVKRFFHVVAGRECLTVVAGCCTLSCPVMLLGSDLAPRRQVRR